MMVVHESIQKVNNVIEANVRNEENPNGLLVNPAAAYLKCVEMPHQNLEVLFRQDEAHWAKVLDIVK